MAELVPFEVELVLHEMGVEPDLLVLEPVHVVVDLHYQEYLMNSELFWLLVSLIPRASL